MSETVPFITTEGWLLSETVPFIMTESWLWASQIADKKGKQNYILNQPNPFSIDMVGHSDQISKNIKDFRTT